MKCSLLFLRCTWSRYSLQILRPRWRRKLKINIRITYDDSKNNFEMESWWGDVRVGSEILCYNKTWARDIKFSDMKMIMLISWIYLSSLNSNSMTAPLFFDMKSKISLISDFWSRCLVFVFLRKTWRIKTMICFWKCNLQRYQYEITFISKVDHIRENWSISPSVILMHKLSIHHIFIIILPILE